MSFSVGIISLGCVKNQVDTELMLGVLSENGVKITSNYDGSDVIVVNTCGFIESAKKEAIDNIIEVIEKKKEGVIKKIIVAGCLSERYKDEMAKEFPEVDGFLGVGSYLNIYDAVKSVMQGERYFSFEPKSAHPFEGKRVLTTPYYSAYIKIAEGCNNRCSYCAIPGIRGNMRSRSIESITEEARSLSERGVKELIIIAQDTTRYGVDIYGAPSLPKLLSAICKVEGIEWIRVMYLYPDGIKDELMKVYKENDNLINYFDIPIQHASDKILKAMNRRGGRADIYNAVSLIRKELKDPVIRTTVMTGFPTEDESDFEILTKAVSDLKFNRLGAFCYSAEEGTKAYEMQETVPEDVKQSRYETVMDIQYGIMDAYNSEICGKALTVLAEGYDSYIKAYYGRSYMDAPDVDGKVFFTSKAKHSEGDFVNVLITGNIEYDLFGEELGFKEN